MGYFEVGVIVNTQGVKGEIRIKPTTDDPDKFKKMERVTVYLKGEEKEYGIEYARSHKQFIVIKFAGVEDMNAASLLRGGVLRVPEDQGVVLEADEYYLKDLYDIAVVDEAGSNLGAIREILFTGANDVYVIYKNGRKDILLPAIKSCILSVDIENKLMTVRLPEGLIEE